MESLLRSCPRKEPHLLATTTWVEYERNETTLELFLGDTIDGLPTYESINGRPLQPHVELGPRECVFTYHNWGSFHRYEMKAKLGLDGDRSWYKFDLHFSTTEYPDIKIFQIDKLILKDTRAQFHGKNGHKIIERRVSAELYTRLLWVGDRLFWSLDSLSGNELCKGMEHTPTQLHDIWYYEVMNSFLPEVYVNLLPLDRRERAVNTG